LDSTLENERKPTTPGAQRTSGDMQTITELTGEVGTDNTNTRGGHGEQIGSVAPENIGDGRAAGDAGRRLSNTEAGFTLSSNRRLSNTQAGFTLSNDNDGSSNLSAKDVAGKTLSGLRD